MAWVSHCSLFMAPKSIEERVSAIEAQLAGKTLADHLRTQAELIDRRLDDGLRAQAELIDKLFVYRFEELDGKWGPRFGAVEADVGTLQTDVGTLKTDVATLKTDVAMLKTDVGTL